MEEIITKDSNRVTIVEIITKNQSGPLWRKCKQWNNRKIEQKEKP